jgi:hypothetical protein
MGLPAVLTDVSGARELVKPGINGYLVPPENPREIAAGWQKALSTPALKDWGSIRRLIVEKFALEDCLRSYERVLELPARTRVGPGGGLVSNRQSTAGNSMNAPGPGTAGSMPRGERSGGDGADETR